MAYSPVAELLRRCIATTKRGHPCRAWAVWGDPAQLCITHGGQARSPDESRDDHRPRVVPCRCAAYQWPHRPGSGFCRWPDPPTHRSATPCSTHQWPSRFRERLRHLFRGTPFGGPAYLADPWDDLLG